MHKLLAQLKAARSMPLRLVAAKVLRRTRLAPSAARRMEVLAGLQAAQVDRMPKLYLRYAETAAKETGWTPVDFRGARVLEIGCGPLAGIAPLAIAGGADAYAGIEPGADPALMDHPAVVRRFLAPALEACRAHVADSGRAPQTDATPETFRARVTLFRGGLEAAPGDGIFATPFDVCSSISCLEHIADLPAALRRLRALLTPDAKQLHLVNFSNHLDKAAPFKHLYDIGPDAHRARYGPHINMLRPGDIGRAFREVGFEVRLLPGDVRPEAVPADLHKDWADKYPREELAIRTALVISG